MESKQEEPSIEVKVLKLPTRVWWYIILGLQSFILVLMLSSFGTESWVKQGEGDYEWKGGLLRVTQEPKGYLWEDDHYSDLARDYCENDNSQLNKALCDTFSDLSGAGGAFIFFEIVSYLFVIFWMIRVGYCLLEQKLFAEWMGYLWGGVALASHVVAQMSWAGGASGAFSVDCKDLNKGEARTDLCNTSGPALVLTNTLLLVVTLALFVFIYLKRHGNPDEEHSQVKNPLSPKSF